MSEDLDTIANPFSAQSEMDIGDDTSANHREREKSISNARTLDDLLHDFRQILRQAPAKKATSSNA